MIFDAAFNKSIIEGLVELIATAVIVVDRLDKVRTWVHII